MDTQPPAANSQTYDLLMERGTAWHLQTDRLPEAEQVSDC